MATLTGRLGNTSPPATLGMFVLAYVPPYVAPLLDEVIGTFGRPRRKPSTRAVVDEAVLAVLLALDDNDDYTVRKATYHG